MFAKETLKRIIEFIKGVRMKKISFKYKGRKVSIEVKECRGFARGLGLMFKSRETDALIFKFNKPVKMAIHSWFVFFPFVAVWLDKKNKLVDIRKVKPFKLSVKPRGYYSKLIEIPINKKHNGILRLLVGN